MLYSNLIRLMDFFENLNDYVVLKLSDHFPNYYDHSDIDILCRNREKVLVHILEVSKKYEEQGFQIKVNRKKNGHLHIDFYCPTFLGQGSQRLNLKLDLLDSFSYKNFFVNPLYCNVVLDSEILIKRGDVSVRVPSLEHDFVIRFLEYFEYKNKQPDKIKHIRYIQKFNDFSFLKVVDKYTNLKSVLAQRMEGQHSKFSKNISISTKDSRIDYFLIWGNGLQYTDQILSMLRKHKDFDIIFIEKKIISNIGKFVNNIYSCDTYPLRHLISKTRYLLKTKPEIIFILVKNNNPQEKCSGDGAFRGVQCQTIKIIKEQIRDRFNPRINGKRTHNHVIHASDYEDQVEHVLKVLDLPTLKFYTEEKNSNLEVPCHIKSFNNFLIKEININDLYANILDVGIVPIEETPHYKYLTGNKTSYINYHKKYFGTRLKEDHFPEAYNSMIANFHYDYKTGKGKRSLILVRALYNKYRILDGVHRAAILKHRNIKKVVVAEILQKHKKEAEYEKNYYYWKHRQKRNFFRYAYKVINSLENCSSVLDVGGGAAGLLQKVDSEKYTTRILLDRHEYEFIGEGGNPPTKVMLGVDFLDAELPQFDVVVCLQVLEHASKQQEFASKLLKTAKKFLIVAVPYKSLDHGQYKNIDETTIETWFNSPYTKKIIATDGPMKRMFCIFDMQ